MQIQLNLNLNQVKVKSLFRAICATVAEKQNQEVNDCIYQQKNPVVQVSERKYVARPSANASIVTTIRGSRINCHTAVVRALHLTNRTLKENHARMSLVKDTGGDLSFRQC